MAVALDDGLNKTDRRAAVALCQYSDAKGLMRLALHLGALTLSGAAILALPLPWALIAYPFHAVLLVFLFAALHESIHRTAFRSRWLNDAVASACGFILLLPARFFRHFHNAHHRHTQDPERDPELTRGKPDTPRGYLWYITGLPYWRGQIKLLVKLARGRARRDYIPRREEPAVVAEARWHLAGYAGIAAASVLAGVDWALTLWVLPAIIGQPALRAYLLAEHSGLAHTAKIAENTRTTLTNPLVRLIAWNMPFHAAHHALPALPFHALPEAHARLGHNWPQTARGYPAVLSGLLRPGV